MSALPRPGSCGLPLGASAVAVKVSADGASHLSGVESCGSVWACPVCAAKIRNHRAGEISTALCTHIGRGGGALLVTLTLPHQAADALKTTIGLVSDGFRAMNSGRAYQRDRDRFGIVGHIRSFEVTHGANGWHPHLHVIVCTAAPITPDAAEQLQVEWQTRWDSWLKRNGWPASADKIGVRVDLVKRDAAAVGAYIAKIQEGGKARAVGNEMARGDLKTAAEGSRTPFDLLADFGTDGFDRDLQLWREFQEATKGRSAIRWSKGLRDQLLDEPELSDDEIAAAEVDGEQIAQLTPDLYRRIAYRPYGEAMLINAAELGGFDGVVRFVKRLRLPVSGVLRPAKTGSEK